MDRTTNGHRRVRESFSSEEAQALCRFMGDLRSHLDNLVTLLERRRYDDLALRGRSIVSSLDAIEDSLAMDAEPNRGANITGEHSALFTVSAKAPAVA